MLDVLRFNTHAAGRHSTSVTWVESLMKKEKYINTIQGSHKQWKAFGNGNVQPGKSMNFTRKSNYIRTRMHSSRMRTARLCIVRGGGRCCDLCPGEGEGGIVTCARGGEGGVVTCALGWGREVL